MSDTYSYEVLEPGGHARLVGNVLDRISEASANPASAVGSSRAMLGDPETASWMERTTAADGAALIESIKGNTLRWNQLANPTENSVSHGVTFTSDKSAGTVTINGTADSSTQAWAVGISYTQNHKYMLYLHASDYTGLKFGFSFGGTRDSGNGSIVKMSQASGRLYVAVEITSGTAYSNVVCHPQIFDLTAMFGAGNEPNTVAEFEALFPEPYYPYDPGSLLPVRMEGVETVGFNQWDEEWEVGGIDSTTGQNIFDTSFIRSKNYTPVFPSTQYYMRNQNGYTYAYAADKSYIGTFQINNANTPANCRYIRFRLASNYGTTYKDDICINLSDPARNGTYEPHWRSERAIAASTYFPDGLRSAGTVYDELRADAAVTRVGAVDLGTLTWTYSSQRFQATIPGVVDVGSTRTPVTCSDIRYVFRASGSDDYTMFQYGTAVFAYNSTFGSDAAAFKTAMSGVMLHYALATPTTTPIDPPLPLSYRTGAGGTERVMVASGTTSAPPIFVTRYPLDPADLAESIAPVDGPIAKTNHQVGDLIMLGFALCKVTTAIARGEAITIGTNVTRTSVAAEIAALS